MFAVITITWRNGVTLVASPSTGALDEQVGSENQMRPDVSYRRPAGGEDAFFDLIGDLRGRRVLDFGCGLGPYRGHIEARGGRWVGLELGGSACTVVGDGERLPFREGAFDAVLMAAVLEHMPDLDASMTEVRRVLKTGGQLFGYASFLEPFHGLSYYHMSHMGLEHLLLRHGFRPTHIYPPANGTAYQIEALFFPRYVPVIQPTFRWLVQRAFAGLLAMNRFFRKLVKGMGAGGGTDDTSYEMLLELRFAVGFNFVAVKTGEPLDSATGYSRLVRE